MGHCVAGKEEGEQVISMKVRHIKLQVVMVTRLSCRPLEEWNTKEICDTLSPWNFLTLRIIQKQNQDHLMRPHLRNVWITNHFSNTCHPRLHLQTHCVVLDELDSLLEKWLTRLLFQGTVLDCHL